MSDYARVDVRAWAAAIRDDLPPNVMLIPGVDGCVAVGSDFGVTLWAMTPKTWESLTAEQRAEFAT